MRASGIKVFGRLFLAGLCLVLSGCASSRGLTWGYSQGAPAQVVAAQQVALVIRVSHAENTPAISSTGGEEIVGFTSRELIARGYKVVYLRGEPSGQISEEATAQPASRAPGRDLILSGEEISKKCRAAREAGAQLIFEFSILMRQKMIVKVRESSVPFVANSRSVEWRQEIRQIALNVIDPNDQSVVADVTALFEKPRQKSVEALQDVLLGLDMVREGRTPATLKLTGKPGAMPKRKAQ